MKQTPGLRRRAIFLWWRESEEAIKNVCWELFRNISNDVWDTESGLEVSKSGIFSPFDWPCLFISVKGPINNALT
jgi:hypothetical protein